MLVLGPKQPSVPLITQTFPRQYHSKTNYTPSISAVFKNA